MLWPLAVFKIMTFSTCQCLQALFSCLDTDNDDEIEYSEFFGLGIPDAGGVEIMS